MYITMLWGGLQQTENCGCKWAGFIMILTIAIFSRIFFWECNFTCIAKYNLLKVLIFFCCDIFYYLSWLNTYLWYKVYHGQLSLVSCSRHLSSGEKVNFTAINCHENQPKNIMVSADICKFIFTLYRRPPRPPGRRFGRIGRGGGGKWKFIHSILSFLHRLKYNFLYKNQVLIAWSTSFDTEVKLNYWKGWTKNLKYNGK